jgi:hypothetical protein
MKRTGGQDEAGQRQQAEQSIHNDDKSLMSTGKTATGNSGPICVAGYIYNP